MGSTSHPTLTPNTVTLGLGLPNMQRWLQFSPQQQECEDSYSAKLPVWASPPGIQHQATARTVQESGSFVFKIC